MVTTIATLSDQPCCKRGAGSADDSAALPPSPRRASSSTPCECGESAQEVSPSSLQQEPSSSVAAPFPVRRGVPARAFRLLGLRPREARLDVIRHAIHTASTNLIPCDSDRNETPKACEDRQRAEVVTAAYRLLDPRKRASLFERVQLLIWTEDDLDPNLKSFWESANSPPPVAPPRIPPRRTRITVRTERLALSNSRDESLAAMELFRNIRTRDRRATMLWVTVAALALSLTVALAVASQFM